MEKKRITVDLDPALYEKLRRLAYIEHSSVSAAVVMVLTERLDKGES